MFSNWKILCIENLYGDDPLKFFGVYSKPPYYYLKSTEDCSESLKSIIEEFLDKILKSSLHNQEAYKNLREIKNLLKPD